MEKKEVTMYQTSGTGVNYLKVIEVSFLFFLFWSIIGIAEYGEGFLTEIINQMIVGANNGFWVRLLIPIIFLSSLVFYILYIKENLNQG